MIIWWRQDPIIWLFLHVSFMIHKTHLYFKNVASSTGASNLDKTCLLWISTLTCIFLLMCIHIVFIFVYVIHVIHKKSIIAIWDIFINWCYVPLTLFPCYNGGNLFISSIENMIIIKHSLVNYCLAIEGIFNMAFDVFDRIVHD